MIVREGRRGVALAAAEIRRLLALIAVEPIAPGAPGGAPPPIRAMPCRTYLLLSIRAAGQYNHVRSYVALLADRGGGTDRN
jgi:hypothetical protein